MRRHGPDAALALLLALAAGGYFSLNAFSELNLAEEGTILSIGERILEGKVLYRDMNHHVSPGVFYLTATLLGAFGNSVAPTRLFMLVLFAASAALVYLLARTSTERPLALLSAIVFILLERRYYSVIYYSPIAIFLGLLSLAALLAYQARGAARDAALAGFCAGVVLGFKQDFAAYTLAANAGALLLPLLLPVAGRHPASRRALVLAGLAYSGGYAAAMLPLVGYFALKGAVADMFAYCVLFVLHGFSQDYKLPWPDPFADMSELMDLGQKVEWVHLRVCLYGSIALFALVALLLVLDAVRKRRNEELQIFATVAMLAMTSFLGAFPRTDGYHVVIVLPPAIVLMAMTLSRLARGRGRHAASAMALLLALPVVVGARASVRAELAERTERSTPFVHPKARVGLGATKAGALSKLLGYLGSHVEAGGPLFVLPYEPGIYYLSGLANPTRYDMVLPGNVNPASEREIVDALERTRVPYIVLIEQYHFDFLKFRKLWDYAPHLYRYVYDHYRIPRDYVVEPTANVGIVGERIPDGEHGRASVARDLIGEFREWQWGTIAAPGHRIPGTRTMGPDPVEGLDWWYVGVRDWMLRRVLFVHPEVLSSQRRYVDFPLAVPEGARLRTGVSLFEEVWDEEGRGVLFEVVVVEKDGGGEPVEHALLAKLVDPFHASAHRRWLDVEVDLSPFAGRDVVLSLRTASTSDTNAYAWAGFGEPAVVRYPAADDAPDPDDLGRPVELLSRSLLAGALPRESLRGDAGEVAGLPGAGPRAGEGLPALEVRAAEGQAALLLHTAVDSALWRTASWDVQLPPRGRLRGSWGMAPEVWDATRGEGARFRASIQDAGGARVVLVEGEANPRRVPGDRRLVPFEVDLAPWAGQRVTIELATSSRGRTNEYGWAIFGDPRIVLAGGEPPR